MSSPQRPPSMGQTDNYGHPDITKKTREIPYYNYMEEFRRNHTITRRNKRRDEGIQREDVYSSSHQIKRKGQETKGGIHGSTRVTIVEQSPNIGEKLWGPRDIPGWIQEGAGKLSQPGP